MASTALEAAATAHIVRYIDRIAGTPFRIARASGL
jgi:hypothetical protein